jgi:LIVCS family branched-chain amino acid:cation transporter
MKDHEIVNIGKYVFGGCFSLGNICLFGYLITRNEDFAIGGFLLLFFGAALNFLVALGLLIYGAINTSKSDACLRAIGILMINIPIAILYAFIGLNLN